MDTSVEDTNLNVQVAGIAATLTGHGQRLDKLDQGVEKLDAKFDVLGSDIRDRIDIVFPRLAMLETHVDNQTKDIDELKADVKALQSRLFMGACTALVMILSLVANNIWHFVGK